MLSRIHIGKIAPLGYGAGVFVLIAGIIFIVVGLLFIIIILTKDWSVDAHEYLGIVAVRSRDNIYSSTFDEQRKKAALRLNIGRQIGERRE